MKIIPKIFLILCIFLLSGLSHAEIFKVGSFNIESKDSNPKTIEEHLGRLHGIDLWGLSEVASYKLASRLEKAAAGGSGAEFESLVGKSGSFNRLAILYNTNKFKLIRSFELEKINIGGYLRAPLVAELNIKDTEQNILFMVNHLNRSNASKRHKQARMLNNWAKAQTLPVIATGTYNYDWHVTTGENDHDKGYDEMTHDGVFKWVRPASLLRTRCGSHNIVLDFVFMAGPAQTWDSSAEILFQEFNYCPDNREKSDHRPVVARFDTENVRGPALKRGDESLKSKIYDKIENIERDLEYLRSLVNEMK